LVNGVVCLFLPLNFPLTEKGVKNIPSYPAGIFCAYYRFMDPASDLFFPEFRRKEGGIAPVQRLACQGFYQARGYWPF
jgi:hypothetical protein